jgi:hypothetical protein
VDWPGGRVVACAALLERWTRRLFVAASWAVILGMIAAVVAPTLVDVTTLGGDDWDQMAAQRYLVVKSLREYHQFPYWNPFSCGGHPAWGAPESATIAVSPWLPVYLTLPLGEAIRVEIVGMALIAALGTWLLAGRFVGRPVLRALVCVLWVVNGRWALQTAAGHTWHLAYAWTPWVFYFFDRAVWDRRGARAVLLDVTLAGASLAVMVYGGGIYPLPETAFLLCVYAALCAVHRRSLAPLAAAAAAGGVSVGLSAPKLFPLLVTLRRFPRLIDSPEVVDPSLLWASLTSHDEGLGSHPVPLPYWGWHEYGLYVGIAGAILLVIGMLAVRGPRDAAWRVLAVLALVLGLGAFADWAPWALLHRFVPVFRSQHVPSRWLYLWVFFSAALAAAWLDRVLTAGADRIAARSRWLIDLAALLAVAWLAHDISSVARQPLTTTFSKKLGTYVESAEFRTESVPRAGDYYLGSSPEVPMLPAMMENEDVIRCDTFPAFFWYYRSSVNGTIYGLGAHGRDEPGYKGEAYLASGVGAAKIESFSANAFTVRYEGASPGDLLVLNQNWDPGWTALGRRTIDYESTNAVRVSAPSGRVTFRYRPVGWRAGWGALAVTVLLLVGAYRTIARYRPA